MHKIPTEIIYIALATAGGIARYLSSYREKHHKFTWGALFVASFVSGFSGYMFALFAKSIALPQTLVYMLAGMGGFLGENALRFLGEYIIDKWFKK